MSVSVGMVMFVRSLVRKTARATEEGMDRMLSVSVYLTVLVGTYAEKRLPTKHIKTGFQCLFCPSNLRTDFQLGICIREGADLEREISNREGVLVRGYFKTQLRGMGREDFSTCFGN